MRTASPDESYSRYSRRLRGSIRSGAASLSPTSPTIPNIARSLPAGRGATDRRLIARSSTAPRERRLQARGGIFGGRSRAVPPARGGGAAVKRRGGRPPHGGAGGGGGQSRAGGGASAAGAARQGAREAGAGLS